MGEAEIAAQLQPFEHQRARGQDDMVGFQDHKVSKPH